MRQSVISHHVGCAAADLRPWAPFPWARAPRRALSSGGPIPGLTSIRDTAPEGSILQMFGRVS